MLKIPVAIFLGLGLVLWKAEGIRNADTVFRRILGIFICGGIASGLSWVILSGIQLAVRFWQNDLIAFIDWIAN